MVGPSALAPQPHLPASRSNTGRFSGVVKVRVGATVVVL